ncbi:MAG: hypothetical protein NC320_11275 [Clostridium sp.]|nr:hypothetical protein [Clostridium sp.]
MKIRLKLTITGMLLRLLAVGATGLRPLMYNIICIVGFILCIGGIVVSICEFDSFMSIVYGIAQIAGTAAIFISRDIAFEAGNIVFTVLILYGLLQALLHANIIYVIYILW